MRQKGFTYEEVRQRFNSLVMVVLLMWLTVSTPFIYESQHDVLVSQGLAEEDAADPLTGTTEEKVEVGNNTLSEYLHEPHHYNAPSSIVESNYKCHPDDLYSAFHPELLSPPPEHSILL